MYYFSLYFWWTTSITIKFSKNILRFLISVSRNRMLLTKYILTWKFEYLIVRFNTIHDYLYDKLSVLFYLNMQPEDISKFHNLLWKWYLWK